MLVMIVQLHSCTFLNYHSYELLIFRIIEFSKSLKYGFVLSCTTYPVVRSFVPGPGTNGKQWSKSVLKTLTISNKQCIFRKFLIPIHTNILSLTCKYRSTYNDDKVSRITYDSKTFLKLF